MFSWCDSHQPPVRGFAVFASKHFNPLLSIKCWVVSNQTIRIYTDWSDSSLGAHSSRYISSGRGSCIWKRHRYLGSVVRIWSTSDLLHSFILYFLYFYISEQHLKSDYFSSSNNRFEKTNMFGRKVSICEKIPFKQISLKKNGGKSAEPIHLNWNMWKEPLSYIWVIAERRLATSRISILFHQSIIIINLLNELRVIYYLLLASSLW